MTDYIDNKTVESILSFDKKTFDYYKLHHSEYFKSIGKTNGMKYNLALILRLKSNLDSSSFVCSFCEKHFLSQLDLMNHRCLKKKRIIKNSIDKKNLISLYEEGYSLFELEKIFNCDRGILCKILSENNIHIRNISESCKLERRNKKIKDTCLEKYGATNVLGKDTVFYKKRNETVLEKYGVSNVFQSEIIKEKIKQTLLKNYGVMFPGQSEEIKNKINDSVVKHYGLSIAELFAKNGNHHTSNLHLKVSQFLTEHNVYHENEACGRFVSKSKDGKYKCPIPDILIEDKKIVIEIYGDFWHGNPLFYKANDVITCWKGKETKISDIWEFDNKRREYIESFGYHVHILWEHDIKTKSLDELLSFLFVEV